MAKYTPTEWVDSLFDEEGNRVQKGTSLSASNLNKLEQGVKSIDGKVEDTKTQIEGLPKRSELDAVTQQLADTVTMPEAFGAVGDGVTIDSEAIQAALRFGGKIQLKQGKTYILDRLVAMTPNTVIEGNGAVIKRIDGYKTTLTSGIAVGASSRRTFTVENVGTFKVGQDVMLYKTNGTYNVANHRITSISGNEITVNKQGSGELDFVTGDFVCTSLKMLQMYDNCIVRDLTFDGNKDNNAFNAKWQNNQALVGWSNTLIENCTIINEQGEGITQYLDNGRIINTRIENCGGNGIHFSGSNNIVVDGCTIKDTNLTTGVGHEDGNLCWSNLCQDIKITNCYLENGKSAFGSIDYDGNSNVLASGNIISNQRVTAIDMDITNAPSGVKNIVFSNNKFYNSKTVLIKDNNKTNFFNNILFTGNLFIDTIFDVNNVRGLKVMGNTFDYSSSMTALRLEDSDVEITNNQFNKGNHVILYRDCRGVIAGNFFIDNKSSSITEMAPAKGSDVIIIGNKFDNSLDQTPLNIIDVRGGTLVTNNKIDANIVSSGLRISGSKVVANGNRIKTKVGDTIRLENGNNDLIVESNYLSSLPNNLNAQGINVIVEGNRVLNTA